MGQQVANHDIAEAALAIGVEVENGDVKELDVEVARVPHKPERGGLVPVLPGGSPRRGRPTTPQPRSRRLERDHLGRAAPRELERQEGVRRSDVEAAFSGCRALTDCASPGANRLRRGARSSARNDDHQLRLTAALRRSRKAAGSASIVTTSSPRCSTTHHQERDKLPLSSLRASRPSLRRLCPHGQP
jgi:hypothetical protein